MTHTVVPALGRGIALLRVLAQANVPMTLSELSEQIGVSRSTVYSLLATLHEHGMVDKDVLHKTYRLGIGTFELGNAYLGQVSLLPAFDEVAQLLVARCGETVKLAVLDGRDVIYLGKQEGLYSVRLVARVGSRMPAHATAVGKLLLAQFDHETLRQLYQGYEFPTRTPHTVSSFAMLQERLRQAREAGYALDDEESTIGLRCVAAPIRDHSGIVAAMSIGVPNDRLDQDRMHELIGLALSHAQEISHRLGWAN
ncbi:MAG: IclR family transcriptional regulator [Roseiflexaceae bacterium]|nr:IclR family transcriptional regulator [Roseiflexaceae bacterium]